MGSEIVCKARIGGKVTEGKALFETSEILFRGPLRLRIPLREIKSAEARDGRLFLDYGEGTVELDLGAQAEKWLAKIRNPKTRLEKLGIKPGLRVSIVKVSDPTLQEELTANQIRASPDLEEESDIILCGIEKSSELATLSKLKRYLRRNGALWVIRPKGSSSISEREVMAAGKAAGLVDVKVASFSSTHTAEKFVIPVRQR